MSKEPSVFELIEKVERPAPPFRKVLPVDEWEKTLRTVGELLVTTVYSWKDLAKFKLDADKVKNKTIFLRTSVTSALASIDKRFDSPLFYTTAKHKTMQVPVIVISTKERIEKAGFTAKPCTRPKKEVVTVEPQPEQPATEETAPAPQAIS